MIGALWLSALITKNSKEIQVKERPRKDGKIIIIISFQFTEGDANGQKQKLARHEAALSRTCVSQTREARSGIATSLPHKLARHKAGILRAWLTTHAPFPRLLRHGRLPARDNTRYKYMLRDTGFLFSAGVQILMYVRLSADNAYQNSFVGTLNIRKRMVDVHLGLV